MLAPPSLLSLYLPLSLTILASLTSSASFNTTNLTGYPRYECLKLRGFTRSARSGHTVNCARAILETFPIDTAIGVFHHDPRGTVSDSESFRVPHFGVVEDCQVSVDIDGGAGVVRGSWLEVWTMANMMLTACTFYRIDRPESAVSGGWIRANGMVVMMQKPGRLGEDLSGVAEE